MTSPYNNVIYIPTDFNQMNYINPYINSPYQYIKYIPANIPVAQPIMNLPVFYGQNNNFSDFVHCEVSIEDGQKFGTNPALYSNSLLGSPTSQMSNNPINYVRSKSPKVIRNNNLELGNYNIYYAQNNSNVKPNLGLNYSIESFEPIKNSNEPLLNNVSNFKPVQYSTNNNLNRFIVNTPIRKGSYKFPNTLSASTIHQKYTSLSRNPKNSLKKSITAFQSPKVLNNNYSPLLNYQTLAVKTIPNDLNNKINNNRTINTNSNNNLVLSNSFQMNNQQKFKSKLLNNNPYSKLTTKSNKGMTSNNHSRNDLNKDINQNTFSPIMKDNSNEKLLNSSSSLNNQSLNKLFQVCSNTHLLSNCPSNSNYNISNIKETSSLNKINISDFNNAKILAGKNSSLATIENKSKVIRHSINLNNNTMNNPFIKNSNTNANMLSNNSNNSMDLANMNIKNNNLLLKQKNTLINTKSNLITKSIKEQRPSDDFSQYMFEQINKIRNNPRSFIDIFKKAKERIKTDKRGNLYYSGKIKVALYKGVKAFDETISSLEKMKPMKSLLYKNELKIKISENKNDFKTGDYLRKKINELIKSGVKIRAFWRDIINDPEINFLLMIVDDNPIRRGGKRKDILNPEMKYIGINSGMIDQYFVCYTVLSDE